MRRILGLQKYEIHNNSIAQNKNIKKFRRFFGLDKISCRLVNNVNIQSIMIIHKITHQV